MKNIDPNSLIGKTIKKIDNDAFNVIHVTFTDDTRISITSEYGALNIPAIVLEKGWE